MPLLIQVPPRITRATFARVLHDAGAPIAAVTQADACYQAIADHGIDPAVALAFARKEHSLQWLGVAGYTRGWGNVTTDALACVGAASLRSGAYQRFAAYTSYSDGAHDWAAYMRCRYVDRGIASIEAIIPIYAPSGDGNDPAAYISAVRTLVAQYAAMEVADPWQAWGSTYSLPTEQRNFAIPSAWLNDGGRLGAAQSEEIPIRIGAARIFDHGAIVWDAGARQTRIYR